MTTRKYISAEMMRRTELPWWEVLRLEAAGQFPRRLDVHGEEWDATEIDAWIETQKNGAPANER